MANHHLFTLFLSLSLMGLVACAMPIDAAVAYHDDDGLPVVENRPVYSFPSSSAAPSSSESAERPMWIEEESGAQPASGARPDTPAAKIDQLQQQVQELQGKLDVQEHHVQALNKQIAEAYQDLDIKIKKLTPVSPPINPINPTPAPSVPSVSPEPQQVLEEADKLLYQQAYSLAQNKQYGPSIDAFARLIQTYPNSQYVATAYFWMGEIYIIQSKYDEAMNSFNQLVLHYPTSPKVSEAAFKMGYIDYARGNNALGIQKFKEVIARYPGTAAAKQADQYLKKHQSKKKIS